MDEDGFLHIHDRVSRFSKIGGEMVPHMAIEAALAAASAETERPFDAAQGALSMVERRSFAVVTLPDRVRGEKVVVVYSGPELDAGALLRQNVRARRAEPVAAVAEGLPPRRGPAFPAERETGPRRHPPAGRSGRRREGLSGSVLRLELS